jgi:hypothetical protein
MRDIQVNSESPSEKHTVTQLTYLSPEQFNVQRGRPYSGKSFYSVIASQIQIFPTIKSGMTMEIVYYRKVPNLNAENKTNWMSLSHPDIYIAGVVSEIELFAKNYDVAKGWQDRMSSAIAELENSDTIERWSGSALMMRVE